MSMNLFISTSLRRAARATPGQNALALRRCNTGFARNHASLQTVRRCVHCDLQPHFAPALSRRSLPPRSHSLNLQYIGQRRTPRPLDTVLSCHSSQHSSTGLTTFWLVLRPTSAVPFTGSTRHAQVVSTTSCVYRGQSNRCSPCTALRRAKTTDRLMAACASVPGASTNPASQHTRAVQAPRHLWCLSTCLDAESYCEYPFLTPEFTHDTYDDWKRATLQYYVMHGKSHRVDAVHIQYVKRIQGRGICNDS